MNKKQRPKRPKKLLKLNETICTNCGLPIKEHLNRDGKCDLDPSVKDRR